MNTPELLKLIYETRDLNRFKKVFIKYFKKNNLSYNIEPLYDGFSRKYQRLTFSWYSEFNEHYYIMGFRVLYNHYIYIDNWAINNRFYQIKLRNQEVVEEMDQNILDVFTADNEFLLECLQNEYTRK